jgi:hypothetical protein
MATIGPVKLNIDIQGNRATVEVAYDINFDSYDQNSNQPYVEVCRLMGDDTNVGDTPEAGADDVLGFVTPIFLRSTASNGQPKLSRRWAKTFPTGDLDEDRGNVPNPDEFFARVTLTPVAPATATAVSNPVTKTI